MRWLSTRRALELTFFLELVKVTGMTRYHRKDSILSLERLDATDGEQGPPAPALDAFDNDVANPISYVRWYAARNCRASYLSCGRRFLACHCPTPQMTRTTKVVLTRIDFQKRLRPEIQDDQSLISDFSNHHHLTYSKPQKT